MAPAGLGIERDDALPALAHHEEREPDRDLELGPEIVIEREVVELQHPRPRGPQLGIAGAHGEARLAGAEDAAVDEVQQVPVLRVDRDAAEVAAVVADGVRQQAGVGARA